MSNPPAPSLDPRRSSLPPDFDLYLASVSPRRQELLQQIGIAFRQLRVDVPEVLARDEAPRVFVQRLALAKARAGLAQLAAEDPRPVLGADTVVVLEERVLGKPRDEADATAMLRLLAGRSHQVMSAVAVMNAERKAVKLQVSTVTFRDLDEAEIRAYGYSGEGHDKAGAYAIQGCAALFIANLEGSYSGVMGLPLFETGMILKEFGINPCR